MKRRNLFIIVFTLFVLQLIVVYGVIFLPDTIREWYALKDLPPEAREMYLEWYHEPIDIDVSQLEFIEFSDEFIQQTKKTVEEWKLIEDQYEQDKESFDKFIKPSNASVGEPPSLDPYRAFLFEYDKMTEFENFSPQDAYDSLLHDEDRYDVIRFNRATASIKLTQSKKMFEENEYNEALNEINIVIRLNEPKIISASVLQLSAFIMARDSIVLIETYRDELKEEHAQEALEILEFIQTEYFDYHDLSFIEQDSLWIMREGILKNDEDQWPASFDEMTGAEVYNYGYQYADIYDFGEHTVLEKLDKPDLANLFIIEYSFREGQMKEINQASNQLDKLILEFKN